MSDKVFFISPEALSKRNRIVEAHRRVIMQMRQVEKEIESLLRASDARWKVLEKERNFLYVQIEPLVEEYWDWVPAVDLSRCPFCEAKLARLFDPVDLQGFWWMDRTQRQRPQPKGCEHFCLLTGAVNLNGLPPQGGLFECRPGPDVPFVIPRILDLPGMTAVISSMAMHCGYTAFPVVYFSRTPVPQPSLSQAWAEKEQRFTVGNQQGWDIKDEVYDYRLKSWIEQGKVRWLVSGKLNDVEDAASSYPFGHIRGNARPQVLLNNELRFTVSQPGPQYPQGG